MYDSEVMCRQKVDTPWSIYRDLTVLVIHKSFSQNDNDYKKYTCEILKPPFFP